MKYDKNKFYEMVGKAIVFIVLLLVGLAFGWFFGAAAIALLVPVCCIVGAICLGYMLLKAIGILK